MATTSTPKTIREPARGTPVFMETDIVVVGAGPGGHTAAIAAARNGAKVVLLERYGHLGGMTTGGLVTLIPHLSDGTAEQQIGGICQEWVDRLDKRGGAIHPKKAELGSSDREVVGYWSNFGIMYVRQGKVRMSVETDPELLKCVLNNMVEEAGVKLLCHSWGVQAIARRNRAQGVIFESKSGRQAILADIVIDGTGDGDLLPSAGADFDAKINPKLRISRLALVFRLANVNLQKLDEFRAANPQKMQELGQEITKLGGFPFFQKTAPSGVVWFNMWLPDLNLLDIEDLTWVEVNVRKKMLLTYDFFKKYIPGFENCYIELTAPQVGTRGCRRVVGEYTITEKDVKTGRIFKDTIAICPDLNFNVSAEHPHVHIPYRAMVPKKVDGLLVTGRSYSAEDTVQDDFNLIPHCCAIGQAVGTAAAMAIKQGIPPREVNHEALRESLLKQGVPLPDISRAP